MSMGIDGTQYTNLVGNESINNMKKITLVLELGIGVLSREIILSKLF